METWTRDLLTLNTRIVAADASLAAALREFYERTASSGDTADLSKRIIDDVIQLTLLRRLRNHHVSGVGRAGAEGW